VRLSATAPRFANQGWFGYMLDKSAAGKPLQIGDRTFEHGVSCYPPSDLVSFPGGLYSRFQAWVGIDTAPTGSKGAPTFFKVMADGKQIYDSGPILATTPAQRVDVDITGVNVLRFSVNYIDPDHSPARGKWVDFPPDDEFPGLNADWADAEFVTNPSPTSVITPPAKKAWREIQSGDMRFTAGGSVLAGFELSNGKHLNLQGSVAMAPYTKPSADASTDVSADFRSAPGGLAWDWECKSSSSKPWTVPVDTVFKWPDPAHAKVWLPWGYGDEWQDPLVPQPFESKTYEYGSFGTRPGGVPLPMATIIDESKGIGVTFIQSPNDVLINMQISTTDKGEVRFSRAFNRFGGPSAKVAFHMDIIVHEPEFRAGLRAMVERYPEYFETSKLGHQVGGGGAYSGYEGPLDAEKLRAMGFTMNWKASVDFPYMGQFLPPVPDDEKWDRFAGGGPGGFKDTDEGRFGRTSISQMRKYSTDMRAMGFHVLNYFNLTEFGSHIFYPAREHPNYTGADTWKDATDFLYANFPNAILKTPAPNWTWGGGVAMDCGDPEYRKFLLEQAKRHIEKIPDSSGICIDRLDWLSRFNLAADDGISWIDGPARHLRLSWLSILEDLGALFHQAGKVVYVNDIEARLELMRHVDGFYDEIGDRNYKLNTSAFLALRKPVALWTRDDNTLKPDPDVYFQRLLYLGAFPTIPVPGNDHTIVPSEWNEPYFLAYGPMFNSIKERKWLLTPGVAQVEGNTAKVNIFETPQAYVVFVGLASKLQNARVTVRGLGTRAKVLHPGEATSAELAASGTVQPAVFDVPMKRGCAMLLLEKG
jgi:hypothetical protein